MRARKVTILRNPDKWRVSPWEVRYRDGEGKRKSRFFGTKHEAESFRDAREVELENFGRRAFCLPPGVREDAVVAVELLAPHGKTLVEAVRSYVAGLERSRRSLPIESLSEKFLLEKEGQVSRVHLYDLRNRLKRFAISFPGREVNSFETEEIGSWIKGLPLGPQSKLHFRRVLHNFFGFCVRHKCAEENPITLTDKIRVTQKEVRIYSPGEVARLLANADSLVVP